MSKRLQVLLGESEYRELKKLARRSHMTVSELVRQAIRATRGREPAQDSSRKLSAVRAAAQHGFPVADIEQMLADIERGYLAQDGS
ncbi:MAG: CopG family transcriptional regulator [Anaerolineae bacterium]|nr:CopG family transcriptional regulator [Gemmatimonadaceae bacterium]